MLRFIEAEEISHTIEVVLGLTNDSLGKEYWSYMNHFYNNRMFDAKINIMSGLDRSDQLISTVPQYDGVETRKTIHEEKIAAPHYLISAMRRCNKLCK